VLVGEVLPTLYGAMTFSYELGRPSLHFVQNHPAKLPRWQMDAGEAKQSHRRGPVAGRVDGHDDDGRVI
jgi:hypothetical protein